MTPLRWLMLPIAVCTLLLVAGYSSLTAATGPVGARQTGNELPNPPVPPAEAPVVSPVSRTEIVTPSAPVIAAAPATATVPVTATGVATYYVVQPGDTLFVIAGTFGTTVEAMMAANGLRNADILDVGQVLLVPGAQGELLDRAQLPAVMEGETPGQTEELAARGTITDRMTLLAQAANNTSPYHSTTWLTYYGRPNIPQMGILGEHAIEDLIPLLRAEAEAYDRANGDGLSVTPAFHLVYGMATKAMGPNASHLAFLEDTEVISYIEAAAGEGWQVILDVQIGALTPSTSITRALKFLNYPNVHLAIDPEFAMVHPGQAWPGDPIGYVTAAQVNHVQAIINAYVQILELPGPRLLLVHQFQSNMIVEPETFDLQRFPHVALTVSVDGWGGPWAKISKYNSMVTRDSPYTAFKLFYQWDDPLLLPEEALGMQLYGESGIGIDVTPNLIIYQ